MILADDGAMINEERLLYYFRLLLLRHAIDMLSI